MAVYVICAIGWITVGILLCGVFDGDELSMDRTDFSLTSTFFALVIWVILWPIFIIFKLGKLIGWMTDLNGK